MGFAEGFSVGANVALRKKEGDRAQKQQELTALQQGYELDQETGSYKATTAKQTAMDMEAEQLKANLEAVKAEVTSLKAQQSADGITNTIANIIDGNWDDATKNFGRIKSTLSSVKGLNVADISPINYNDPRDLKQMEDIGIDTSKIVSDDIKDAFNRSMIKVTGLDGNTRIVPVDQVIKETNTMSMFNRQQKDLHTNTARNINSILQGKGLTYKEQQAMEAGTELAGKGAELKKESMETFFKNNPEAKWADWEAATAQHKPASMTEKASGYKLMRDADKNSMIDYVSANRDEFNEMLSKGDKKIKIGDKNIYEVASAYQGDTKPDTNTVVQLDGTMSTIKSLGSLKKDIDKLAPADYNALSRFMTSVRNVGGDFVGMSDEQIKKHAEKVGIDTKKNLIMVKLIKAMSGLTVSDKERDIYATSILSGNWSDKSSSLAAIDASINEMGSGSKDILDSFKHDYPKSFLDRYTDLARVANKTPNKAVTVESYNMYDDKKPTREEMIKALQAAQGAK